MRLLVFLTFGLCVSKISGEMVLDDPDTWTCNGEKVLEVDLLKKVLAHCGKQDLWCRHMCIYQHAFVVTGNFTFEAAKAKKVLETFLPDKADVAPALSGLVACAPKLHANNTDSVCSGNIEYVQCAQSALARACKLPEDAFRFKNNAMGRNVVLVDGGNLAGGYMNGGLLGAVFGGVFG